jgi:hypothetical protein
MLLIFDTWSALALTIITSSRHMCQYKQALWIGGADWHGRLPPLLQASGTTEKLHRKACTMKHVGVYCVLCCALTLASAFSPPSVRPAEPRSLHLAADCQPPDDEASYGKRQRINQWIRRNGKKYVSSVVAGGLAFFGSSSVIGNADSGRFSLPSLRPPAAHASAPVMALPKAEGRDPASEAIMEHERRMIQKAQADLRERDRQAREIERTQGEAARVRFEKAYQAKKEEEAAQRTQNIENLKRSLLDEGIDPFTDMEGRRQMTLLEKGVDLGEVSGTPFNMEKEYERKSPQKSMKVKKQAHRRMIACIVKDMKNRGVDPLQYFETHQERTMSILDLPAATAQELAQQYEANLESYGQITVPKEGELSVKEKMAQAAADPKARKAAAKKAKEEERARLKAEKLAVKEKAKQAKLKEKQLKQQEKEKANQLKEAAKVAAAAATASAAAVASGTATSAMPELTGPADVPNTPAESMVDPGQTQVAESDSESEESGISDIQGDGSIVDGSITADSTSKSKGNLLSSFNALPVGGAVVLVAGGGYTIRMFREKAAAEEEERQRQFRMLMGEESDAAAAATPAPALEEIEDEPSSAPAAKPPTSAVPTPSPPPSKKRRLGIFKKKSERETDISNLISPDSPSSDFSKLLAKILSFGAPGRFPSVESMPEGMPFDAFDIDLAKQLLVEQRTKDDIPDEESAEVFANVVNCMLIDIVDLASSSLKEKETKKTVEALNIVVEFMNHAASLYDAVAGDTTIKPVVYEGALSKAKLEQMFSSYAASGMTDLENLSEDFDSRVNLLQDVFQISEKKAEGLMMKAMQKQMMEMMKDPKGMEEMMKNMGGMEGLGDLMGGENGEDIDTEQLMGMMRELKVAKDRGEISKEDLESVRGMFKETFGSGIDNLDESGMSEEDKQVLAAMKEILND